MRAVHTVIAGVVAIATVAIIVPSLATAGGAASAPTAPYTAFTVDTPDYSVVDVPDNSTFTMHTLTSTEISFEADGNDGFGYPFDLVPATGGSLSTGTFAIGPDGADATHVGLSLARDCQSTGTVRILQMTGTTFAASVEVDPSAICATGMQSEIRYNSTIGYTAAMSSIRYRLWQTDAGGHNPTQDITFTGLGSTSTVFGAATFTGDTGDFSITANACSGKTIGYGQTCTVTVDAYSGKVGHFSADLVLADNSGPGTRQVSLNLTTGPGDQGSYYPMRPERIVDTRSGIGSTAGVPTGPLQPGGVVHLLPAGESFDSLPNTGVGAVVFNVTVTAPTAQGFLTLYPTGSARPTASSVNYTKGWTGANSVTVATGTNDGVDIYSSGGSPQLIIDIVGFYASGDSVTYQKCADGTNCGLGGNYLPVQPQRLFDSRYDLGHQVPAGGDVTIPIDYGTDVTPHITALAVNVTAVNPTATGFVTAWDGDAPLPNASTVNYVKGKTVPNMTIIPVRAPCGSCQPATTLPSITVHTTAASDLLVDIVGIFDDGTLADGLRFAPITPKRIVDSRYRTGIAGPIGAGATAKITTPTPPLTTDTVALALNVTAVTPTASTFITVWPSGDTRPTASTLNPSAGQTVPNATIELLSDDNAFDVYNDKGTTQVLVDVVGTFYIYSATESADAAKTPRLSKHVPSPTLAR